MDFYLELHVFVAVPVRKKKKILTKGGHAGFFVFPGLPLFYARSMMTLLLISSYIVCIIHICVIKSKRNAVCMMV